MAQIIINIPDNQVQDILDAFAAEFKWTAEMGITKAAFAKARIIDYIKFIYKNQLTLTGQNTLSTTVSQTVNGVTID